MKKFVYTLIINILFVSLGNSQTLITSIHTPKGYTVPDTYDMTGYGKNSIDASIKTDMSPSELTSVQNYAATTYTSSVLISGSTYLYNCHSFAWNKSEQGPNCWIGLETKTAEDIYWNPTQGGYIEVPSEDQASKVSYYLTQSNHSAVTTHTLGIVRSKWGPSGLYEHAIGEGPYEGMDSRKYYKLRVDISSTNHTALCYNQSKIFTTPSLNLGETYSWSCSDNLLPVSGQNTNTYTV